MRENDNNHTEDTASKDPIKLATDKHHHWGWLRSSSFQSHCWAADFDCLPTIFLCTHLRDQCANSAICTIEPFLFEKIRGKNPNCKHEWTKIFNFFSRFFTFWNANIKHVMHDIFLFNINITQIVRIVCGQRLQQSFHDFHTNSNVIIIEIL